MAKFQNTFFLNFLYFFSPASRRNTCSDFFFSCEVGSHWDPRTKAHWPITLSLWFKFIRLFRSPATLRRAMIPLSLASFICSGSILGKPKVCILTFSNTWHSHRMCTDVSFSAPHILHEGVFALLILWSIYRRLMCPVRSPTNILQCFSSSLLMNWTYLSVGPSRHSWIVQPFTDSPLCLFPFFNPVSYLWLKSA